MYESYTLVELSKGAALHLLTQRLRDTVHRVGSGDKRLGDGLGQRAGVRRRVVSGAGGFELTGEERDRLVALLRGGSSRRAVRARIVLALAEPARRPRASRPM
jgi:hypothetical protein